MVSELRWLGLLESLIYCHSRLRGNVLYKPLDSSFRWNDNGGGICATCLRQAGKSWKLSQASMLSKSAYYPSFQRKLESRRAAPKW